MHPWATVICIMQACPLLLDLPQVSSNCRPRWTAVRLSGLLFSAIVGLWVAGCASLPTDVVRPVSTALANSLDTGLGQFVAARAAKAGTRNSSGFALVSSAELAFTSRMTLIKAAQKTLDIQYYAIFADDTTERMFDALREAAARGVRIRILLDDFNTSGRNAQVLKLAFEKNMEMRLFNPLPGGRGSLFFRIIGNLRDVEGMQRRMHNKIFVADNAVAITGGRNLGETYFGQSAGTNFIDIDLLAAGPIARDLSRSFDQYWNNPLAYPVQSLMTAKEIEALKAPPAAIPETSRVLRTDDMVGPVSVAKADSGLPALTGSSGSANATTTTRVVTSPGGDTTTLPALPDDTDLRLLAWTWAPSAMLVDKPAKIGADADSVEEAQDTTVDGLLQLMTEARRDLLIVSPYFVPGQRMMKQLESIRQRGVRVRVLTNSLASNDAPAAHVGYARYREALLRLGIELYEMRAEHPSSVSSLGSLGGSMRGLVGGSRGGGEGRSRASLHAKVVVIDDRLLVVGSMNLDLRSQLQNSEVAIVVRNRAISAEATRLIEPAISNGAYHVELDGTQLVWRAPQNSGLKDTLIEPDASAGFKLLLKIIGPLAPDEML